MDTQNTMLDITASTWEENPVQSETAVQQGLTEEEFRLLLQELSPVHASLQTGAKLTTQRSTAELTPFQKNLVDAGLGRDLLLGQYVLEDKLGEGGMGVVYRAVHMGMDRQVALKVLSPQLTSDKTSVLRFLQEVRTLSRLSHPNIVTAFDACHSSDRHFLVMEYVDGTDLDAIVKHQGPLSVADTVNVGVQICEALEFVHRRGIVHRDIKPSNLLVDTSGFVKVLDLGLAKLEVELENAKPEPSSRITQPGILMGTVDFLSPEQARDTHSATIQSDIYSLGCTLFLLLTGRPPYEAETILDRLIAHRDAPVPALRDFRRDIPKSLDRLVKSMLAKDPRQRPASMSSVAETLGRIGRDFGICRESLAQLALTTKRHSPATSTPTNPRETADQWDCPFTQTLICGREPELEKALLPDRSRTFLFSSQPPSSLVFKDWLMLAAVVVACLAIMFR